MRAERDWAQADLAERLGVSRQTVNAIEKGKYDPGLSLAYSMSRLFGVPVEEVFIPPDPVGTLQDGGAAGED